MKIGKVPKHINDKSLFTIKILLFWRSLHLFSILFIRYTSYTIRIIYIVISSKLQIFGSILVYTIKNIKIKNKTHIKECPNVQLNGTIACNMTGKLETFSKDAIMCFGPKKADMIILFRGGRGALQFALTTLYGLLTFTSQVYSIRLFLNNKCG